MRHFKAKVLFVCMSNTCRSPTAEAVLRKKLAAINQLDRVKVDSAGTHNFHPNSPPDEQIQAYALKRGYDLSALRARSVEESDFTDFDLLITMDWNNRALLEERCPPNLQHKIRGFAEFLQTTQSFVIPDPYDGGVHDLEHLLDLIEEASEGLIDTLIKSSRSTETKQSNL